MHVSFERKDEISVERDEDKKDSFGINGELRRDRKRYMHVSVGHVSVGYSIFFGYVHRRTLIESGVYEKKCVKTS